MIKFKTPKLEEQLKRADKILQELVKWVHDYCLNKYGKDTTLTEVTRTRDETVKIYIRQINPKTGKLYTPDEVPSSTHETIPCRAADKRSLEYTSTECLNIVYVINATWIYDPDRPNLKCCVYHKVGDDASHFHLQVHPNTVIMG